ncbi:MAG: ABC transporter ATP-binding protein [Thermoleophilia bacterium]|nr:ABC transporter ATP-binding protein [Thermoleophilia bacterium]
MSALELSGVSIALGANVVVRDVSESVEEGEWVVVIGPNGAGKTTLLRAIGGLLAYDGEIKVGGEDAARLRRDDLARRVAFLPQAPVVPEDMSVADYVLLGRTPHLGWFGRERADDVAAAVLALERLDLVPYARRRLGSLSGGERQRAVLARALAQDAPLLVLDEPTAALDVGRQQQVLELVDRLRAAHGLTVLSAMHELTLAGQFADRLLLLDGGAVVASGAPSDVLTTERVARHYGASVRVVADEHGVVVVPARAEMAAEVSGRAGSEWQAPESARSRDPRSGAP